MGQKADKPACGEGYSLEVKAAALEGIALRPPRSVWQRAWRSVRLSRMAALHRYCQRVCPNSTVWLPDADNGPEVDEGSFLQGQGNGLQGKSVAPSPFRVGFQDAAGTFSWVILAGALHFPLKPVKQGIEVGAHPQHAVSSHGERPFEFLQRDLLAGVCVSHRH
jgi:hypothetical protein